MARLCSDFGSCPHAVVLLLLAPLAACATPQAPVIGGPSSNPTGPAVATAPPMEVDQVGLLMVQLRSDSAAAQREAAARQLATRKAKRAIGSLIEALVDADATVRAASSSALGDLVDASTKPALRDRAQAALGQLAKTDADEKVRSSAASSQSKLEKITGGIYVSLGKMSATPSGQEALKAYMGKEIAKVFASHTPPVKTQWPGGPPSSEQLEAHRAAGYFVNGTLASVRAEAADKSTKISCEVSILIATYPDRSILGFADGQARVQAAVTPKGIKFGKEACVSALVENLVARKVVKTLEEHAAHKP